MNVFTKMSEKGQVVIPKDVRDRHRFAPGDQLEVIDRRDGVLLRRPARKSGESFDVIAARINARIRYGGPPVSIDDMNAAVAEMWVRGGPGWDQ